MMRVFLADDEELARLKIRDLLEDIPDTEICGEAENGTEAVKLIGKLKPDLLLLDIQMPGLDGFEFNRPANRPGP